MEIGGTAASIEVPSCFVSPRRVVPTTEAKLRVRTSMCESVCGEP